MFYVVQKSQIFFAATVVVVLLLSVGMYNFAAEEVAFDTDKNLLIIDAGHGGMDGGAVGTTGVLEKDLNLKVAKYLCEIAESDGKKVIMTRREDVSLDTSESEKIRTQKRSDLENRRKILNENSSGIFVSIHMNKFEQQSVKGAQVFYAPNDESRVIAQNIQTAIRDGLADGNNRVAKEAPSGLYIFKGCNSAAVVVECGFVSNPDEEKLLMSDEYQKKIAECIYAGLCK